MLNITTILPSKLAASLVACTPHYEVGGSIVKQCGVCELFATIQNVIDFMFHLAIPIGVGAIIVGGFYVLIAGDSEKNLQFGKDTVKSAIIGIALTLGSWMILNSFLSFIITGNDGGIKKFAEGWKDLSSVCGAKQTALPSSPGGGSVITPGGGDITPAGGGANKSPGGGANNPAGGGEIESPGGVKIFSPGGGSVITPGGGDITPAGGGANRPPGGGVSNPAGGGEVKQPGGGEFTPP